MIWILLYFYVILSLTLIIISDWQDKDILSFIFGYVLVSVILPIYLLVVLFAILVAIGFVLIYPFIFLVQLLKDKIR